MMAGPCFLPVTQSGIKYVAIAVGPSRPNVFDTFFHAVILYRHSNGQVCGLDISTNGIIESGKAEQKAENYAWAIPSIEEEDILENIASFCESLGEKPRNFTYAFEHFSDCKIAQHRDQFIFDGSAAGFTCATLVLGIFQTLEYPLLNLESWSINDEDQREQLAVFEYMETRMFPRGKISREELERRRSEIPCVRYSPKMVIGSCRIGNHPSDCAESLAAGRECMKWLQESGKMHGN